MKLSKTKALNSYNYGWLLKRIFPYIRPVLPRVILGFMVAIPLGLLDGIAAYSLRPYMDYVIKQQDYVFVLFGQSYTFHWENFAIGITIGIIFFAIIQGVLRYLNTYISEWTSKKITNSVKIDLFKHLVQMDARFFDKNSSGIIMSRFLNDPQTAADGLIEKIKSITTSICSAFGLICVMIYNSWKLALIGVIILCVAFVPVFLIRKLIRETSNKNMVISGNIRTNMNETCSGNRTMTSYQLQNRQAKKFEHEINNSFNISMHLIKRSGWMSPFMHLIASIGIAFVLGYGTDLIATGQITAGNFTSFVAALLLLYKPIKTLGTSLTSIQKIFVAMGRIFELFDIVPSIRENTDGIEFEDLKGSIDFENLYFEYKTNSPVLKNINLSIQKNETIAIVGNSGGGKSTIVSLLLRLYDATNGIIKLNNINIKEYTLKSIRDKIAVVFQDNFLYSGTIRENILIGKTDNQDEPDESQMTEIIKAAYLDEMINHLPKGMETVIGERGVTLSGGERQRIAIARAMVKNAPILILDEATSALDNHSEAMVQKALNNLMKDKTVIIIAHRLSTIQNANRIAVLNNGNLAEIGKHEELMQIENGHYKALYYMQFNKP